MGDSAEKKQKRSRNGKRRRCIPGYIAIGVLMTVMILLMVGARWFKQTYTIGCKELFYTLTGPLKGTSNTVIMDVIHGITKPFIKRFILCAIAAFFTMDLKVTDKLWKWCKKFDIRRAFRYMGVALCLVYSFFALMRVDDAINLNEFIRYSGSSTNLYDKYYVEPATTGITAPEKKKNLVFLYLESMETTYASEDEGGYQDVNYMPGLTKLAYENTSFSDKEGKLGGYTPVTGVTWTMGSMMGSSSGVPYSFPIDANGMDQYDNFAPRMTNLGDILLENGYHNEFLCGSDAEFGGRKNYFTQHGNYQIYDLFTARENGIIPEDYYVWWGFEDTYLYDIAKSEIARLAEADEPFNFTFLTVDTHHMKGYVCDECGDEYDSDTANVVACADRQACEFVEWLKAQPFYEDTVLVIMGDHPRMDTYLVDGVEYHDRKVYNCILNSDRKADPETMQNREFAAFDMFPTILYAMGFDIDSPRLGIGTNMYSGEKTLAEELGIEKLDEELNKRSKLYLDKFWN